MRDSLHDLQKERKPEFAPGGMDGLAFYANLEATDELRHLTEEQRQQAARLIRALRAA